MNPSSPSSVELDKILDTLANQIEWCVKVPGSLPIDREREGVVIKEALASIQELFVKEMLEVIGEDETKTHTSNWDNSKYLNNYKSKLRTALKEKFNV